MIGSKNETFYLTVDISLMDIINCEKNSQSIRQDQGKSEGGVSQTPGVGVRMGRGEGKH